MKLQGDAPGKFAEKAEMRPVVELVPVEVELLQTREPALAPLRVGHGDRRWSINVWPR